MKIRDALTAWGPPTVAAVVGSIGSRHAPQVYARLVKPRWAPPGAVFGPVWTALYGSIGAAAWRMLRHRVPNRTWALHATQLVLNAAWPWAFFAVWDKRASLAVIVVLDAVLAVEIADVARRDRRAGAALAPYLGWSLFATALNAFVGDPEPSAGEPGSPEHLAT